MSSSYRFDKLSAPPHPFPNGEGKTVVITGATGVLGNLAAKHLQSTDITSHCLLKTKINWIP